MKDIWRGLRFMKKSFQGWWVIAAYHHPKSITWRWSLSFDGRYKRLCWPGFGPGYSRGTKFRAPNGQLSIWLRLPLIGTFSFNTQKHMWRDV